MLEDVAAVGLRSVARMADLELLIHRMIAAIDQPQIRVLLRKLHLPLDLLAQPDIIVVEKGGPSSPGLADAVVAGLRRPLIRLEKCPDAAAIL